MLHNTLNRKTNLIITCPAVTLAANRKLSARGRRTVLINSIIVKNGLSHIGALSGRKCAINFFIEDVIFLMINTHTHPFNGSFSGTTQVSRYQKGKTNLDFTEARDREWQWHQLEHMQVCTSLQTDNHASTPPLSFLQAGCPSCRPTNSVKTLKA